MYPQVVQFETRRLQLERELGLGRERRRARAGLEDAPGATRRKRLRLRAFLRSAGWSRRAARAQA